LAADEHANCKIIVGSLQDLKKEKTESKKNESSAMCSGKQKEVKNNGG
jgi:hypothetical protein